MTETHAEIVFVHGLWVSSWSMGVLAHHLRKDGFATRRFSYSSTHQDPQRQAEELFAYAVRSDGTLPNLVAHSLGGLITLRMLVAHPGTPSGRVVLMGSPVHGSSVASRVGRWPGGHFLFGTAKRTLTEGVRHWPEGREVGMISGTRSFGIGLFAGGARHEGDGTVLSAETRHQGLRDRIELPVTHTSMLFSSEASRQAAAFIRTGRFEHDQAKPAEKESIARDSG